MTGASIGSVVKRCAMRAGQEHAHVLRHTSAPYKVGRGHPDETYRSLHGWGPGSTRLQFYSRSTDHFQHHMLELHVLQASRA